MARGHYCVLKGRPRDLALDDDSTPHIEIKVSADGWYRVAVNAQSNQPPHDLLFRCVDNFQHKITKRLLELPQGLTDLTHKRALALDYTRRGMLRRRQMRVAPFRKKGPKNDLRELLGFPLAEAINDKSATLYSFGESWGPEDRPDIYFGFQPGRGLHDVHMNQGSRGRFRGANRGGQDGALMVHFGKTDRWVALFLAFQTQSWRTDRQTGHPLRKKR